jgi:large conductance mechanosensitive channel
LPQEDKILEELKRIRELLEPKPTPPLTKGLRNEFRTFLSKYGVVGLTVGFIFGIYLGALTEAFVNALIMPIFTFAVPVDKWENIVAGPFRIGHFASALITFFFVAFVIFLIIKAANRWEIK